MSENKDMLFAGFEVGTGKEVYIPIFHMLVAGQTQLSGKTTLLKTLANQAVEHDYKILVFDSKSNYADYDTFGQEIPICFRETTDSLTILGLLESIMQRKLSQQYATLIRATEGASNFDEVLENAEAVKEKTKVGFVHDAATTLVDLMTRLIKQTKNRKTSVKLELPYSINRMTINRFALEAQQMVIKTAIEDALDHPKLIVIIDEMSKFLPQIYSSACKPAIERYVTQGAITKTFLWGGSQYLATTAKSVMKAMDVKILGRQSHDTECEHTLDLIPKLGNQKWTESSIMQLKLGHFVVAAENWVKIVYTVPEFADRHECHQVAMGKREPKDIHYRYEKLLSAEEIQKLQKALANTEIIQIEKPEKIVVEKAEPHIVEPTREEKREEKLKPKREEKKREEPKRRRPAFTGKPFAGAMGERIELLESNIEAVRIRVVDIEKLVQQHESISLETASRQIRVEKTVKQVKVSDETYRGKILTLAKEHFFSLAGAQIPAPLWRPLREIVEALERHGWSANSNSVKMELYAMADDKLLGKKQNPSNKEFLYTLAPNIEFV